MCNRLAPECEAYPEDLTSIMLTKGLGLTVWALHMSFHNVGMEFNHVMDGQLLLTFLTNVKVSTSPVDDRASSISHL